MSLSLRSTSCKGNKEEPKLENVSNCCTVAFLSGSFFDFSIFPFGFLDETLCPSVHLKCISVGGLWMDRPGRSPSQSSNCQINPNFWVLNFLSLEIMGEFVRDLCHSQRHFVNTSSQKGVGWSVLILSDAEMQYLIQLVANVSVLIGAQVNLVTAALAHCPPSTYMKQIENKTRWNSSPLWNLCKASLGKLRQHGFQVLSSKRITRIDEFVGVCSQESSRRITSKHSLSLSVLARRKHVLFWRACCLPVYHFLMIMSNTAPSKPIWSTQTFVSGNTWVHIDSFQQRPSSAQFQTRITRIVGCPWHM